MKHFVLLLCAVMASCYCYAVTLVINPSPTLKPYCPLVALTYSVSNSTGGSLPSCTYTWTVSGGTISGSNVGTSVQVIWADQSGKGTLTVTTSNCTSLGENGSTKSTQYTRHSVWGTNFPTFGTCNSTPNKTIPLCSPGVTTLCVDPLYVTGTGGVGEPLRKEVDRYIFTIPAGWRANGATNGPAQVSISTRTITIEPLPGTNTGATVSVVGSVSNTCGGTLNSNPFNITLIRTPIYVDPPAGFTGLTCGYKAPIIFRVTPLSCASNYAWTFPSGWTGSSSTQAITLTPSGTGGGDVTATITLSTGGTVSQKYSVSYSPTIPAPTVTTNAPGTYEWCNYESFTFTATPPAGYATSFGYEWYASNGQMLINGASTTQTTPNHTQHNYVTVAIGGSVYGPQAIGVRMNNQANCPPSPWAGQTKRVGPFSNSEFSIIGPSNICPNQSADFRPNFIESYITGYQWGAPSDFSTSGQGTPYFHVSVPSQFYGGAIILRLQNRCGWTNTPYMLGIYPGYGCGYTYSLSPNPSSATLRVGELDEENGSTITIKDKTSKTVREVSTKKSSVEIDVSDLKSDTYVLVVKHKGTTESQHIVINH